MPDMYERARRLFLLIVETWDHTKFFEFQAYAIARCLLRYIYACLRYSFEIQAVLAKQRNADDFNSLLSSFFIRLTTFFTSYFNDVDLFLDSSLGYLFSFRCTVVRSYNGSMETTTFYLSVKQWQHSFATPLYLSLVEKYIKVCSFCRTLVPQYNGR